MTKQARVKGIGMLVKQVLAGSAAVITAVVGLSLVATEPAAAAGAGVWRAYGNTNPITSSSSDWSCGSTVMINFYVRAQACTILSADKNYVQPAVIVRNDLDTLYKATATMSKYVYDEYMDTTTLISRETCPLSGIGAQSWSVCFGTTTIKGRLDFRTSGDVNGTPLPFSPWVQ
ncbi:MAG TPA: hypothetical protein VFV66_00115 [Nonomuraea sp.]|nr:hypothetical protein [Nonomuraea sp.]